MNNAKWHSWQSYTSSYLSNTLSFECTSSTLISLEESGSTFSDSSTADAPYKNDSHGSRDVLEVDIPGDNPAEKDCQCTSGSPFLEKERSG